MSDEEPTVESLRERLEAIEAELEAAETEDDLDEVESQIESLEADVEEADLPEPEDEDETPPEEELTDDIESVAGDLEDARGPYAADVVADLEAAVETVESGEWTETGEQQVADAVGSYLDAVSEYVDTPTLHGDDPEAAVEALQSVATDVEEADLDPDDDAETIAGLVEATDALAEDLDDAEEWDDLTVRQQLDAQGYYDVLDHRKDFPPEWGALKVYEKRGEAEPILLALDTFDSDFMEEHCMEALERMGPEEALDEMLARAGKRDKQAIRVLGTIGSEEPVETLLDYVDADVGLQKVTFQALGKIGSEDAVQPLADQLVSDDAEVRSAAARALGLIGDTRAIDPLGDVLADEEESGSVRASAAWALVQIGTEDALDTASEYVDDREYLVQAEAEKAQDATAA
ncbi:PBS lyase HEAT domain-containing protein repeat-containing protein [Salinarchaeum sp. Harcht-Bsk1]|uniref:HEAT repeat domain-containing protein n=1 Tax=Salinarchaeum sp. Harcht-Bsk1 TaxID=1333523 RepID=UPI0003422F09|nr:HEAT repeat domain-containing protein [Salinarchaeum sp. Harcht-Bsk1]AGN02662.1 PBS lyase HEAT domain-containing protein repeat-containing protein [Salinarchaeum sp. Harcht-Bsk1]